MLACAAILTLTFFSCEEGTGPGTGGSSGPITNLTDVAGNTQGNIDAQAGSTITVVLDAISGDNEMNTVRFLEAGSDIDPVNTRVSINGSGAAANPVLLFNAERQQLLWTLDIVVHSDESVKEYAIVVTDDAGVTSTESFLVNTVPDVQSVLAMAFAETTPYFWPGATPSIDAGTSFVVGLSATRGDFQLFSLAVYENGNLVDISRLDYNDVAFGSNPSGFPAGDEEGFFAEIKVVSHTTIGATRNYNFVLEDTNGDQVSVNLDITTNGPVGTPISQSITGALLNAGGPAGTGGLDLDFGVGTGSTDGDAEIRDLGINSGVPLDQNWFQQIAPANNASMRMTSLNLDQATFDGIAFTEEILDQWNAGTDVNPSPVVNIGDTFVVERNGTYYLIRCTNIEVTAADNNDFYEFSIKY